MLEIYDVINYVCVDGGGWGEISNSIDFEKYWLVCKEDISGTDLILDHVCFEEAYEYLRNNSFRGIQVSKTFFTKKPKISVRFAVYDWTDITKCKEFSLRTVYSRKPGITLDWIMKHLEADTAIQYLTERGMGVCPKT